MLSQKTQKLLNELFYLMEQRTKIDEKIEALFSDGTSVNQPTAQWYKSEAPVESTSKHQRRKDTIVLKFTDEEMEKMIRESDEGKTAREIMREYGFQSTSDWYLLKSKYAHR
jgi:hypothetical protein